GRTTNLTPRRGQRLEYVGHVVAAELADEARVARDDLVDGSALSAGERPQHDLAHLLVRRPEQRLELLVRHLVEPCLEEVAARLRKRSPQSPPVLQLDDVPAAGAEASLELCRPDPRDDTIERLPVEVDDPKDVAEVVRLRLGDGLPDASLVELGVPEQRDEPSARRRAEVALDVAVDERGEERRRRAEPDGAGREVDREWVLRLRRIALKSAELPETEEIGLFETSDQILECVKDRRRVRLDADPVRRVQIHRPQGRHDRDERRGRGLVTADLQRI